MQFRLALSDPMTHRFASTHDGHLTAILSRTARWMAVFAYSHGGIGAHPQRAAHAMSRSIILRKVRGISGLTPMWRTASGSFGSAPAPSSVVGFLTSPLVLLFAGVLALIAWILADPGSLSTGLALATVPAVIVEKRQELEAKQKSLTEVMDLAGRDLDFSRKPVMEKLGAADADDALLKFQTLNREAEALGLDLRREELKHTAQQILARNEALRAPVEGSAPLSRVDDAGERKSLGRMYIESKEFADSRRQRQNIPVVIDIGIKTLMQTTAGFAPESVRTGRVVEAVTRPIQVLDLIPSAPIDQAVEKYMEQTTRAHSAAERAEAAAYAESAFVYTEKTSDVRSVGDSIPVTDEQLEDAGQVAGLLDQQLRFGVMQRIDGQVLTGNGTAPNLRGINNVVGIQTLAKGTDSVIAAFLKALKNIRVTGRANPNAAIMHPNDWTDVLLTQNANGDFLFGNPFQGPGPQALFGIPVAQSDAQTENTALIGDFLNFCRLGERKGVEVEIGYVGTQFTEGKKTLRATARVCFTVYRPAAFIQLTGI